MLRAQIDNDRDSVGGSGIEEVTFRPLSFAEHRTFAKRSHVKDRKGFDMTYFGSTRVVDQAFDAFPDKPRGMHWRTYDRLRHIHDVAEARSTTGLMPFVDRLGQRSSQRGRR